MPRRLDALQTSLFARGTPALTPLSHARRTDLDLGAWYDHTSGWIAGADDLFIRLRGKLGWREQTRRMYERSVAVPRLLCPLVRGEAMPDPLFAQIGAELSDHYRTDLGLDLAAYYRDGNDSVAWHADRIDPNRATAITVIASLGGPRRLLIRPRHRGPTRALTLASGDLLVLGGTIHQHYVHCVPKCAHAHPRIALLSFGGIAQSPRAEQSFGESIADGRELVGR